MTQANADRQTEMKRAMMTGGPIDTSRTQYEKQRVMGQEHRNNVQKIIMHEAEIKRLKEEMEIMKAQIQALNDIVSGFSASNEKSKKDDAPKTKKMEAPAQ